MPSAVPGSCSTSTMLWCPACTGTRPARWAGPLPGGDTQPCQAQPLALSQRVLTAEFCEGCKVNDLEAIKSMGLAVKDVSAVCIGVGGRRGEMEHRAMVVLCSSLPR